MIAQKFERYTAIAVIATLLGSAALTAQVPAADPWARVPAAPTSCYTSDGFQERLSAAQTANDADLARQKEINGKTEASYKAMDMGTIMVKMQDFMMKNPQEAMKVMQAIQGAGQTTPTTINTWANETARLDSEFTALKSNYQASLDKALAPARAKQKELKAERNTEPVGEAGNFKFKTAALETEFLAAISQENTDYEKVCATMLGDVQRWLTSYKSFVVEKYIPQQEEQTKTASAAYVLVVDTGGYKPTANNEGVQMYLKQVSNAYGLRLNGPATATQAGFVKR